MPGRAYKIGWVVLLCSMSLVTQAQVPNEHVFTQVEGLSHNSVFAIVQDRTGFLWFGTADGLNRYDGYAFTVYRHDPSDSTSLSNNTIRALLEDAEGNLWIATETGIDRFDPLTERFVHYTLPTNEIPGIWDLEEGPAGTLWVSTTEGLFRYESRADQMQHYPLGQMPDRLHVSMSRDAVGRLWVSYWPEGADATVGRFEPERNDIEPLTETFQGDVYLHATAGRLWLVTEYTIAVLDKAMQRMPIKGPTHIRRVHEDSHGQLWIGGENGLFRFDPEGQVLTTHALDPLESSALTRRITAIYEDRAGTLWVGTLGGLFRYDPHIKRIARWQHAPNDPNSLGGDVVMAVYEAVDEQLWAGLLGGGLSQVDRTTGQVTRYRHRSSSPTSLCHDTVWAIYEDEQGIFWLGTDAGLCRFDRHTKQFAAYPLPFKEWPYINVLLEGQDRHLWIGGEGLHRLNLKTGTLTTLAPSKDDAGLRNPNVQALHQDAAGYLWIGYEFAGLSRLDPPTRRFVHYPFASETGLLGKAVRFIHERTDGSLWLGTDMGLVRFDPMTETFRHYLQRDGLPGSNIYGILEDEAGFLWVSTNQGLVRFDPDTETIRLFGADGDGHREYNRRAAFKSPRGELFFGSLDGLMAFFPEAIRDNPYVPPVAVTRIQVFRSDSTLTVLPAQAVRDGLVLGPRDASFSVEFAALNYTQAEQNRYAYRLEGLDEGWVDAGTRRFVRYTGVPPGEYVFRVKGSNNDGIWNEAGTAIRLTVQPSFWQTGWFRLIVVMALAGLLAMAYRYRVGHLLNMERLRLRIASDLHDEIGSKLSSIALASEMVTARAALDDRERRQLTEVTRQARGMVDDLRDIVWVVNPHYDRLADVVTRMRHLAAHMLDGTRHTFEAREDLDQGLGMEQRRHLYLMYREALTNVLRHAQAKQVAIRLTRHNGMLELTIHDDGVGFDPLHVEHGDGLHNLRTRARALGGTVTVESHISHGTTVHITARIPENRDGFRRRSR